MIKKRKNKEDTIREIFATTKKMMKEINTVREPEYGENINQIRWNL